MKKPLIIAHRGVSALAPENTLAAFRQAVECGAEGLEFDVQLSKDDVPVIIHDFDLKRLGRRDGFVKDFTAEELQTIDVGSWFNLRFKSKSNEKFSSETVPTLAQLLKFLSEPSAVADGLDLSEPSAVADGFPVDNEADSQKFNPPATADGSDLFRENPPATAGSSDSYQGILYVELKFADDAVEKSVEKVCEMLLKSKFLPQIKLKSFNLKAVKYAKENFPAIRTVALFEPQFQTVFRKKLSIFDAAEAHLADEISLHFSLATRKTVETAKNLHLPVTIWTVDRKSWVKRAADFGIEAVISNNPALLLAEKGRLESLKIS